MVQSVRSRLVLVLLLSITVVTEKLQAECRGGSSALPSDLTEVGLKELLSFDLEVTSPAKKAQKASEVASAVYVITGDDIRRSGVTHVAEALRLVPGVQVARITTNRWAITVRGFNSSFANKLLVLIDGQSVFTPIFNGVIWHQNELRLEDISRIEVIRGPGASVWGSNAVNGVINIITCEAGQTQGSVASIGGGTEERFNSFLRHGGEIGPDSYYRVFGSFRQTDQAELRAGGEADDEYDIASGGFRIDSDPTERDHVLLKVDGFHSNRDLTIIAPQIDPPFVDDETYAGRKQEFGARALSRWTRRHDDSSESNFQLDYAFNRDLEHEAYPAEYHTAHLDLRHRFSPVQDHDMQLGFEYRYHHDHLEPAFVDTFDPASRTTDLFTWFFQDEIAFFDGDVRLLLGAKLEKNAHTGFELMPNGRILWAPDDTHTVWGAVSRAVVTPSRVLDDVVLPVAAFPTEVPGLTGVAAVFGDRDVEAQDLTAYEIGYRYKLNQDLSLDLALFFNDYNDLESAEPGIPEVGFLPGVERPLLIVPSYFGNGLAAQSYGGELALEWRVYDWWRLVSSYSLTKLDVEQGQSADSNSAVFFEGVNPEHQAHLRSHIDLPHDIEFDALLRFVDRLSFGDVDSYAELDLRLGWRPTESVEFSLVGTNLLHSEHQEFEDIVLPSPPTE